MKTQAPDVGDSQQFFHEPGQVGIGCGKWVTTTENHFLDIRICFYVIKAALPLVTSGPVIAVGKMAPETIPAMDRATGGGNQKHPAGIFMQKTGSLVDAELAQRVIAVALVRLGLGRQRQYLQQ